MKPSAGGGDFKFVCHKFRHDDCWGGGGGCILRGLTGSLGTLWGLTGLLNTLCGLIRSHNTNTYTFFVFLVAQHHAQASSISQGRICFDNLTCCHTGIEAADQTCCYCVLTLGQPVVVQNQPYKAPGRAITKMLLRLSWGANTGSPAQAEY